MSGAIRTLSKETVEVLLRVEESDSMLIAWVELVSARSDTFSPWLPSSSATRSSITVTTRIRLQLIDNIHGEATAILTICLVINTKAIDNLVTPRVRQSSVDSIVVYACLKQLRHYSYPCCDYECDYIRGGISHGICVSYRYYSNNHLFFG